MGVRVRRHPLLLQESHFCLPFGLPQVCTLVSSRKNMHNGFWSRVPIRTEEILQGANLNSKEPKWTFSRAGKRANHKIDKAKQLIFVKRAKLPLNKPLIPPIFFTIAANLVYCDKSSCTSRTDTPQPRATRVERPGWRENSFAPLGLSSSENEKSRRILTRKLKVSVNKPFYSALHCTILLNTIARAVWNCSFSVWGQTLLA